MVICKQDGEGINCSRCPRLGCFLERTDVCAGLNSFYEVLLKNLIKNI